MVWCMRGACFRRTIVINQPEKKKKKDIVFEWTNSYLEIPVESSGLKIEEKPGQKHQSQTQMNTSSEKSKITTSDKLKGSDHDELEQINGILKKGQSQSQINSTNSEKSEITSDPWTGSDSDKLKQINGILRKGQSKSQINGTNSKKTEITSDPCTGSDSDEPKQIDGILRKGQSKSQIYSTNFEESNITSDRWTGSNSDEPKQINGILRKGQSKSQINGTNSKKSEITSDPCTGSDSDEPKQINGILRKGQSKSQINSTNFEESKITSDPWTGSNLDEPKQQPPLQEKRRSGVTPVRFIEKENDDLPVHTKHPDDQRLIRNAIENNDFLNKIISEKRMEDVIAAMYIRETSPKELIIKQGDKGSHMYVSVRGKYQTIINGKVVNEFADIRVFGELAILYNAKRLATIKAVSSGRVWVLDSSVYQQIVIRHHIREQDETMNFLMNNEILKVVGKDALQIVANLLKSEFFSTGKEIVRQGDKGQKFYIIRAGTVTITKDEEGVVGVYKKGDCFGELALLEEDCRQATVTANAPGVECLTLTRKEFIDHLGDIKDFKYIRVKPKDSIKSVEAEYEDLNLMDLKIRKTLGVGGFGRVELVQHTKNENIVFALKYLKKVDVVAQSQEEHVYNEKNIQIACRSPFIVRLYRTYKDQKYIYFLMESCLGGDLWSLLQKQKNRRFEEKEARFICACVLEAFDYLHSRGVVYRDLKPENLLIALNGYIKLTDFGFAKKLSGQSKTFTFAGTPEYVAPEIVLNRGHNRAVDYWAYGAFIFEMLTGRTPFRTDDSSHMRTYNKILSGIDNIHFPTYVNLKARHLIEKLCQPVASERLGMSKGGIQDIRKHKWYLGYDWQAFAKLQMPSPFKPKLSNPIDTKYFDQFKRDNDTPPDEVSGWDEKF